jgi:predicted anti-sigma-YlaC factor YlaD
MDGSVDADSQEEAAAHLATCDSCRLVVDETNQLRMAAREHAKLKMPEDVRARIRDQLRYEDSQT